MSHWRVSTFAQIDFPSDIIVAGNCFAVKSGENVVLLDSAGGVVARRWIPNLVGIARLGESVAVCSLKLGIVDIGQDLLADGHICDAEALYAAGIFVNSLLGPIPLLIAGESAVQVLDRRRRLLFSITHRKPVLDPAFPDLSSLRNELLVDVCVWKNRVIAALVAPPALVEVSGAHHKSLGGDIVSHPRRLITDGTTVYVLDSSRVLTLSESGVDAIAGGLTAEDAVDGPGEGARFALGSSRGLALDKDGTLLVADFGNDRIRRIRREG